MNILTLSEAWRRAFAPFPLEKCPVHPGVVLDLDHDLSTWTSGQWSVVQYRPCSLCAPDHPTAID
jgi:hypothetical protein